MPRYMFLLPANKDSETGTLPTKPLLERMHAYNASLAESGILVAGEGLAETAKGARVIFPRAATEDPPTDPASKDAAPTIKRGPFPVEQERLLAGFWIIKAKDLDEAVGWAKKAPLMGTELEVRLVQELEDFGDEVPPQMKEDEERWRREATA
ncbi:MAG: hypothetical protein M1825_004331 [Sarcosagium campestre]|nr:MAG: hypothetical protein M1825_004331 [Sarcosagium campestre]